MLITPVSIIISDHPIASNRGMEKVLFWRFFTDNAQPSEQIIFILPAIHLSLIPGF